MTVQEAIKTCFGKPYVVDVDEHEEAIRTIKEALEEVEQYRALGTVEELKEAREKQVAKKPIKSKRIGHAYYYCPNCDASVTIEIDHGCERDYRLDHCDVCGQKIDWSESE